MYVTYCRNKPDSSLLIQQHGVGFFEVTPYNHTRLKLPFTLTQQKKC